MKRLRNKTVTYTLTPGSIDEASVITAEVLREAGTASGDVLRCQLSVEEILGVWKEKLGCDTLFVFSCGTRLGKHYITLTAEGVRADPRNENDELYSEMMGKQSLFSGLGLYAAYSYSNGINEIRFTPPVKKNSLLLPVGIAAVAAIIAWLFIAWLPDETGALINGNVITPLFDTLMNLLSTIAGPLIFLAVCSGIYSIGDLALLGKIGGRLITRLVLMTFAGLVLTLALTAWFFPISFTSGSDLSSGSSWQIYEMILNIVPTDIVTPFQNGNALQIIFLACACGVGVLILGKKVSALADIVGQLHSVVSLLMEAIGRLVPLFVFICVLQLALSDTASAVISLSKQVLLFLAVIIVMFILLSLTVCIKYKVRITVLLSKFLPTFLVALTTASSAAAFGVNVETCESKLGIERKLVNFGVPLGQVIFMPGGAVTFFISSMCIAQLYDVTITPTWIVISILASGLLAIATPPIPGGALSCYTVLFTQLGLPASGVALAISIDIIMDFVITAFDLLLLQCELVMLADGLDMLDKNKLAK